MVWIPLWLSHHNIEKKFQYTCNVGLMKNTSLEKINSLITKMFIWTWFFAKHLATEIITNWSNIHLCVQKLVHIFHFQWIS
jgi:hypothetical protein